MKEPEDIHEEVGGQGENKCGSYEQRWIRNWEDFLGVEIQKHDFQFSHMIKVLLMSYLGLYARILTLVNYEDTTVMLCTEWLAWTPVKIPPNTAFP